MAIECDDLWRLANMLAGLAENSALPAENVEPVRRTAINRAYYAAYHRAQPYAMSQGYRHPGPNEGSSHSHLWRWYKSQGGAMRLIGNLGFATHDRRKVADYDLGQACPSLEDQLEEAALISETLHPLEDALPDEEDA